MQREARLLLTTLLLGGMIAVAIDGSPVTIIHLMFWIGLYPRPYLNLMQPTVNHYVARMQERQLAAQTEGR